MLQDLTNIDFDIWCKMDLPINLFFILRNKIDLLNQGTKIVSPFSSKPEETLTKISNVIIPTSQKVPERVPEESNLSKIEIPIIKQGGEEKDVLQENVNSLLNDLLREVKDISIQKEVLMKIHMIIVNIINNPMDPKFRSIKTSNKLYQSYLSAYKSSIAFLNFAGFDYSTDKSNFEFKGEFQHLKDILDKFDNFLLNNSNVI
jgi:hypothetical protein